MSKGIAKKGTRKKKKEVKASKYLIYLVPLILIFIVVFVSIKNIDKEVIIINDVSYTEKDFNMYAYLVKKDYFGNDITVTKDVLNTLYSESENITIGDYLKDQVLTKMKISSSIMSIAQENKISLDSYDYKEIEEEKKEFIESVGGSKEFYKLLKDNNTNENSYDEISEINKLYEKIYETLYSDGKRNDLTDAEKSIYSTLYKEEYVKIKQIVFLKKDLDTNTYLDDTKLNQKLYLANSIVESLKKDKNFDNYIQKYSEGYNGTIESEYYKITDLVEELRNGVSKLKIGSISGVISTDNAYHIVLREELDDKKLTEYLDSIREDRLIDNIAKNMDKLSILKTDYFEKISIN